MQRERESSPARTRRLNARRTFLVVGQVVISLLLVGYLLSTIDRNRLVDIWRQTRLAYVVLALALQFLGTLISSWKWRALLLTQVEKVSYRWCVGAYLTGQFFGNFLPTVIGGDAVRAYQAGRRIGRPAFAVASVFVERLTGFAALTLLAWIALPLSAPWVARSPQLLWTIIALILIATAAVTAALATPLIARLLSRSRLPNPIDWQGKLLRVAENISDFSGHRRALVIAVLWSIVYQLSWTATNIAAAYAFGLAAPWSIVLLMVPLSDIVGMVPIFFNNLGAREGTYVLLLGAAGIPAASALAMSFLILVVRLLVSIPGGIVALLSSLKPKDVRAAHQDVQS